MPKNNATSTGFKRPKKQEGTLHINPVPCDRSVPPDDPKGWVIVAYTDADQNPADGLLIKQHWLVGAVAFQLGGPGLLTRLRAHAHRPVGEYIGQKL